MCDKSDAGFEVQLALSMIDEHWSELILKIMKEGVLWEIMIVGAAAKAEADLPNEEIANWSWVERMNWFVKDKNEICFLISFHVYTSFSEDLKHAGYDGQCVEDMAFMLGNNLDYNFEDFFSFFPCLSFEILEVLSR